MGRATIGKIKQAQDVASAGVDYSPRLGATCPWCGKKTKVVNTQPWEEGIRIRFHKCQATGCVLNSFGTSIKSIEVDPQADRVVIPIKDR